MRYDKNSCSYGQQVIGSFTMTTYLFIHHISCRVFGKTSNHPGDSAPFTAQIWSPETSGSSKTKITFEREEISDPLWDSRKYDGATYGYSNKGFCRVFWTVEEILRELCEVPRWLLWRGLRHHCPVHNIFCIFPSRNVSSFHITWLDTFWTELCLVFKHSLVSDIILS